MAGGLLQAAYEKLHCEGEDASMPVSGTVASVRTWKTWDIVKGEVPGRRKALGMEDG